MKINNPETIVKLEKLNKLLSTIYNTLKVSYQKKHVSYCSKDYKLFLVDNKYYGFRTYYCGHYYNLRCIEIKADYFRLGINEKQHNYVNDEDLVGFSYTIREPKIVLTKTHKLKRSNYKLFEKIVCKLKSNDFEALVDSKYGKKARANARKF